MTIKNSSSLINLDVVYVSSQKIMHGYININQVIITINVRYSFKLDSFSQIRNIKCFCISLKSTQFLDSEIFPLKWFQHRNSSWRRSTYCMLYTLILEKRQCSNIDSSAFVNNNLFRLTFGANPRAASSWGS